MSHTILDENAAKKAALDAGGRKQTVPFWLHNVPDERRCTAKSKQSGRRCKRYATPGKRVCHYHGGRSTGPKEPAVKTGEHALEMLKIKAAERVKAAADTELRTLQYGFAAWFEKRLATMSYAEFRRVRPAMSAFTQGKLSARRLAAIIEGKATYHHDGRMSE